MRCVSGGRALERALSPSHSPSLWYVVEESIGIKTDSVLRKENGWCGLAGGRGGGR